MRTDNPEQIPPIQELKFWELLHLYAIHGQVMRHSVSKVASPEPYNGPPEAGPRGTAVHLCAKDWMLAGQPADFKAPDLEFEGTKLQAWVDQFKTNEWLTNLAPRAVEYQMAIPEKSIGGSFDLLARRTNSGRNTGQTVLIDYKSKSPKWERPASSDAQKHKVQLGGYLWMFGRLWPCVEIDKCWIVYLTPHKAPEVVFFEPYDCLTSWETASHFYFKENPQAN